MAALRLGPDAASRLLPHRDAAGLTGRRFVVKAEEHGHGGHDHVGHDHAAHDHVGHGHHHHDSACHHHDDAPHLHGHRAWSAIRATIEGSPLDARVKREAVAIFGGLAEAEGQVHGVPPEAVAFHEVGAVDSIVDIVAAAQLIALVDAERWTASPPCRSVRAA